MTGGPQFDAATVIRMETKQRDFKAVPAWIIRTQPVLNSAIYAMRQAGWVMVDMREGRPITCTHKHLDNHDPILFTEALKIQREIDGGWACN